MEQKVSHINFLADFNPPMIAGPPMHPKRILQGIGKLCPQTYTDKVLPIQFLIGLSTRLQPKLIHIAVQLQTLIGLRGGHICLLKPAAFMGNSVLLPPFKFQKHPVLVCLLHVPRWLIEAFLSFQTSHFAPIIPWSSATYKAKYKELTKAFKLCKASHSSRHTFASIHSAMGSPIQTIAQYMIHVRETTTKVYVHDLKPEEYQLLMSYPDYFRRLSIQFAPSSDRVLECYPARHDLRLKHE